jgi:CRISPR-associated protein Cmr1
METPPDVKYIKDQGEITQIRRYQIITPLYGGGVNPNEADPITVVRGTGVRGQLRFWWRAMRGNTSGNSISDIRSKEESIWGSSETPSKVNIAINNIDPGNIFQPTKRNGRPVKDVGDFSSQDSYVAFPLRRQNAKLRENVEFDLEISYPTSLASEVESALWAWETFGGIGARTRRGFGALLCSKIDGVNQNPKISEEIANGIREKLNKWIEVSTYPKGLPHLSRTSDFRISTRTPSTLEAWRYLINRYKNFRQSSYGQHGLSHWPAPDVIRRKDPNPHRQHQPRHPVKDKIPRAKFGLPIIFQFKHDDDPGNTTLQGINDIDRMASPLILKPLQCSDGAVGLALILEWDPLNRNDEFYTPPGGLQIVNDHGSWTVKSSLTIAEANQIDPMSGTKETDPLKAFLKTF